MTLPWFLIFVNFIFLKDDEEELETSSVSSDLSDILLEGDIEEENDKSTNKTSLTGVEGSGNVIT